MINSPPVNQHISPNQFSGKKLKALHKDYIDLINEFNRALNCIHLNENWNKFTDCIQGYHEKIRNINTKYEQAIEHYISLSTEQKLSWIKDYIENNRDEQKIQNIFDFIEDIKKAGENQKHLVKFFCIYTNEKEFALKFTTEIFKLISVDIGQELIDTLYKEMKNFNNSSQPVLCLAENPQNSFRPNISIYPEFNQKIIDEINKEASVAGYEKTLKIHYDNLFVKKNMLNKSVDMLLNVAINQDSKNVSLKSAVSDNKSILCYSPCFTGIAHEMCHILRAIKGEFAKDIKLSDDSIVKAIYDTAEEHLVIKIDKFSERNLLEALQLPYRVGHSMVKIEPQSIDSASSKQHLIKNLYLVAKVELGDLDSKDYIKNNENNKGKNKKDDNKQKVYKEWIHNKYNELWEPNNEINQRFINK